MRKPSVVTVAVVRIVFIVTGFKEGGVSFSAEELITAREKLFESIVKYFLTQKGVKALFVAGSLAAGTADEFSDIDLRVVVASELHSEFVSKRLSAPEQWGELLYNEWLEGTSHCVSHFKPFNKVDVFYYSPEHLQPSPWYSLPIQVIYDSEALVKRVIEASKHLTFTPNIYEVEQVISKSLACTHEVYRQVMRGELFYAQALLSNVRYWMIQADDYLSKKPPHSSAFAHFKQRGSQEIIEAFNDSYPLLERKAIISALVRLLNVYRRQIVKLHEKFPLARDIETDLYSLDMVVEWCREFV